MKHIVQNMITGLMVCLLLAGCGGGGGTAPPAPAPTTTLSGVVADGYLVGATVCLDTNNNRTCDAGEPTNTTGAGGSYTLASVSLADAAAYPVLVQVTVGVVDEERGAVTKPYILAAPAGRHGFVSPLTTLVLHYAETNNLSADAAEAALRGQMGLDLSLFDDYRPGNPAATDAQKLAAAVAKKVADALATALASSGNLTAALQQVQGQLAAIVQQARDELAPPVSRYTVTPSAGANGSISPATAQSVAQGSTTSFTVTPASGYTIAGVNGCGGTLNGTTYTTGAITGNCTVSATFSQLSYTVTPSAGTGGSISPAAGQTIGFGGTTSFTVTPDSGYAIATVSGCGGTLNGTTYTTGAITGSCTVNASFIRMSGNANFTW